MTTNKDNNDNNEEIKAYMEGYNTTSKEMDKFIKELLSMNPYNTNDSADKHDEWIDGVYDALSDKGDEIKD